MSPRMGLTVDRVTRAAADLADEIGLDNVTVSALARSFGVKDASLYSHIANLEDLRTRVALLGGAEMIDLISAEVAGRSGKDALVAFAGAYREFALRRPGRYAATQIRLDPARVAAAPGYLRDIYVTYGMLRGYGLTEPDLTDAGRLLRGTFHGLISIEAAGGFAHSRDIGASWDRIIDALHHLLENWPTRDPATDAESARRTGEENAP